MPDLSIRIGSVTLNNPVIIGSGDHVMTAGGLAAARASGAGAVVAKSINESAAAKRQLDGSDHLLLDSQWRPLPWDFAPPPDAMLFGRSGLHQAASADWIAEVAAQDRAAAEAGQYVIGSIILADLAVACELARQYQAAGIRILELNIGAPHGDEAVPGAIIQERAAHRVREITAMLRQAIAIPLWIKLTGQSEDVAALAAAAQAGGADAVIVMGRFMALVPDVETRAPMTGTAGAIGGPWSLALTCRWLAQSRKRLGPDFPLLGTNGARSGLDVVRFLLAGARAVEMTSAVMAGGFARAAAAVAEIEAYLARTGGSVEDLIGLAADRQVGYGVQPDRPGYWRDFVPPESR
ncbi:beta/alpha barrel domain-containing protein [Falsiroseomonas selenitidurans]|uniref:dihydrouracil dehydrogenase (NAD(+)) n=1 Tax=Falsiroseomonas selenitidurans TaxID=2716335 RepID=A0ABX1E1Y6_9PROT|nr:dihydroorotate dehydrogenase [Falsiroseomonas selenitidurans]NKC30793.1 dihydroorotate dehydrogenase [Falsiroseomonas selenitidurans]